MPIYEFECSGCGKKIELVLPMTDRGSPQSCPECQASMNRVVSVFCRTSVIVTGRDQVLASLNAKDDGLGNKPRIKNALWKGLNQTQHTVAGIGLG